MPEYLAPGVYVEETSFRAKSIEGVSTSTTGFVGPTRIGPVGGTSELITSIGDFERIYGGLGNLTLGGAEVPNYLAHAVRNYFENGGSRLYVSRAFEAADEDDLGVAISAAVVSGAAPAPPEEEEGEGEGEGEGGGGGGPAPPVAPGEPRALFVARFPGSAGNGRILLRQVRTPATKRTMNTAPAGSLVHYGEGDDRDFFVKRAAGWQDSAGAAPTGFAELAESAAPAGGAELLTVNVVLEDADGRLKIFEDLGFDPAHPRWIGHVLAENPGRRTDALENTYALVADDDVDGFDLQGGLFEDSDDAVVTLSGGNDGGEPGIGAYQAALAGLAQLEDISIVAAPGSSAYDSAQAVANALISHAERPRAYRIAVLDSEPEQAISEIRDLRSRIDSTRAALYYPWVVVANPLARPGDESVPREIALPPSGFVCGIYARSDVDRGVFKAPANEVVRGALRFARDVSFAEQEVLNPSGINALRYFPGRGYRVWGARTASSDPEWKYVNVRRYFLYLEQSIERGTQWAVFEPNGERLWANVRDTISSFLYNEWRSGALLGTAPQQAYFVRCDRSTMTQNDLDNGRLICEIGVAVLKPAEFVIFRIGQKTADART